VSLPLGRDIHLKELRKINPPHIERIERIETFIQEPVKIGRHFLFCYFEEKHLPDDKT
jgi:hypothetical protein